jgi:hypothetical protein
MNGYIVQYFNTGGVWVNEGSAQRLPDGVIISGNNLPGQHAEFNPNSTSSSGTVTLQNTKGSQKTITLTSSTGRVRID